MSRVDRRVFLFGGAALALAAGARSLISSAFASGESETFEVTKSDEEWRRVLTPKQYAVLREEDTERAGTSPLDKEKRAGMYHCAGCDLSVFSSESKFDSGTGWPSFWAPVAGAVATKQEGIQYFIPQTEVHCRRCGGHLGHVFKDGPPPTGLRYCINGVALRFEPQPTAAAGGRTEKATFAAGCFWHVEQTFRKLPGVVDVTSGYTGGTKPNPSYEDVCTDKTGHAEAVLIEFDPAKTSYEKLLDVFWSEHDPTELNRQGPDVGTQYRSAIFYRSEAQKAAALASKERLEKSHRYSRPIVTQILPAPTFYRAEEYHQRYFEKHPEMELGHAQWPTGTK
jgi:peptide methionine sulfoxide reductase msrA/msrB